MSDTKKTDPLPPLQGGLLQSSSLRVGLVACVGLLLAACSDSGTQTAEVKTCESSGELVEKIAPIVGGEIAAFAVSNEPQKMPLLTFKDAEGKAHDTAGLEGKTVLFNLWATWCAPCREEMPAFDKLQSEFGGEDFAVVPVSVDRGGPEKPLAFYEEIGLQNLPFFQDETMGVFNALKKQSLAFGLPVTILLDKEGCILGSLNGPAEWAGEDAKALVRTALGQSKNQ